MTQTSTSEKWSLVLHFVEQKFSQQPLPQVVTMQGENQPIFSIFTPQNTAPLKQMLAENKPPTSYPILTKFKLKHLAFSSHH